MDDDAGTMSSWFVLRSIGFSTSNIGTPVYYITSTLDFITVSQPGDKV